MEFRYASSINEEPFLPCPLLLVLILYYDDTHESENCELNNTRDIIITNLKQNTGAQYHLRGVKVIESTLHTFKATNKSFILKKSTRLKWGCSMVSGNAS